MVGASIFMVIGQVSSIARGRKEYINMQNTDSGALFTIVIKN